MERSAVDKSLNKSVSDAQLATFKVSNRPVWVENEDFVVTKNYDLKLKADPKTQEELDKLEIKADTLISKDHLALKFSTDEIFYDVTK